MTSKSVGGSSGGRKRALLQRRGQLSWTLILSIPVCSCCALPFLLFSQVDDPDVTVLTDSNYHSFVQADLALVEFYGQRREQHKQAKAQEDGREASLTIVR
jgi:hypothetical protein